MEKNETEEIDEVESLLNEMRANGKIYAHPMMYVSALHNRKGCYPVNQDDEFFQRNGIEFIQLAPKVEQTNLNPPEYKYVVSIDDSGAFRHSIVPNNK